MATVIANLVEGDILGRYGHGELWVGVGLMRQED